MEKEKIRGVHWFKMTEDKGKIYQAKCPRDRRITIYEIAREQKNLGYNCYLNKKGECNDETCKGYMNCEKYAEMINLLVEEGTENGLVKITSPMDFFMRLQKLR